MPKFMCNIPGHIHYTATGNCEQDKLIPKEDQEKEKEENDDPAE